MKLKFEIRGICYAVISDETVEVARNRDTDSEVILPERVAYEGKNYRVTKIGIQAFYGNRALTKVFIPNSVTEIGESAFAYCTELVSVNIPEGVEKLAYESFCGCEKLKTLVLPNSMKRVEERALWYCRSMETISIPKHLLGVEYPKILPKRASEGGQCRGMDSLKHCFVRLPSGEIDEFDVE